MSKRHWPKPNDRPKQECPAELVNSLLGVIRNQFCSHLSPKEWYSNQKFFKRVILYPAKYLNQRGVTLPPKRYQAIVQNIFQGIKQHGATKVVGFWPGYLLHCVQQHFEHHGEDYYNEGKSIRELATRAMLGVSRAQEAVARSEAPLPVEPMATAYAILSARKPRRGANTKPSGKHPQLSLL